MNKKLLAAANAKFPLLGKEDFVHGESFIITTPIIKQRQLDFIDGAKYADAIGFSKWLDDNYVKRSKGFIKKHTDPDKTTYYSYEELYEKYLP